MLIQTERRLVWILGSPRSGCTWLMNLLAANGDVRTINEPGIGVHLGAMLDSLIPVEPCGKPEIYRLAGSDTTSRTTSSRRNGSGCGGRRCIDGCLRQRLAISG